MTTARVDAAANDVPWAPRPLIPSLPPVALATALGGFAIVLDWRGADLAAQVYRANLFRSHGFVTWNDMWFGGHPTLIYSVLFPALGAVVTPVVLGVIASVLSAWCVDLLLRPYYSPRAARAGSLWFAASTATNVAVGRMTFAVGLAFALFALLALQRGRRGVAAGLGALAGLASPVAAVFVAIAAVAWSGRGRYASATLVLAATLGPLALVAALFPSNGVFPFEPWKLEVTLLAAAAVFVFAPRGHTVVRRAAVVYAVASVATFTFANPLGGNISRLAQYAVGPILVAALWGRSRRILVVLALPILLWQWYPAVDGIALAHRDPSTHAKFFAPLVAHLSRLEHAPTRVEIPVTRHHWESVYVAASFPLARGWERQLDMSYNGIFYGSSLTPAAYEQWLTEMAVGFVALPRAPLDDTAFAEAALLRRGLPYLTKVWQNRDWTVWSFDRSPGLVSGPAVLDDLGVDRFRLAVAAPGDVLVRVRASRHWAVPPPSCVDADPEGWTIVRHVQPGTLSVVQSLRGTPCDQ